MGGTEAGISWNGQPATAWLPDPLGDDDFAVSAEVARRLEPAADAVRRAGDRLPASWEPLARLLLRAEGIASSSIEGVRAPIADVALAEVGEGAGGEHVGGRHPPRGHGCTGVGERCAGSAGCLFCGSSPVDSTSTSRRQSVFSSPVTRAVTWRSCTGSASARSTVGTTGSPGWWSRLDLRQSSGPKKSKRCSGNGRSSWSTCAATQPLARCWDCSPPTPSCRRARWPKKSACRSERPGGTGGSRRSRDRGAVRQDGYQTRTTSAVVGRKGNARPH